MSLIVLVVEDDVDSLELICETLSSSSIEVRGTRSPLHAAVMLEDQKFDGIFLDLSLPGMDGMELARRARKSISNATTPIVVISGRVERDIIKQAFAAGAQFYLPKPIDRVKLKHLVSSTLGSLLKEHSRSKPVELRTQVSCHALAGDCTGFSSEVSDKGIVFQFDGELPLHPGDFVHLSFRLPFVQNAVLATATITRVMRTGGSPKADCRFETLDPSGKQALRDFLPSAKQATVPNLWTESSAFGPKAKTVPQS